MNWDQIEGKWKRFTGSAERWGKLTTMTREEGSVARTNTESRRRRLRSRPTNGRAR